MSEPIPILLIHGFAGGVWDYHGVQKFMKKKGRAVDFFEFKYGKRYGQVSLERIAENLKQYVNTHLKGRKFYAIGFSQGGIIWRTYAMQNPDIAEQVVGAFTVCTPHSGSVFAYFGLGDGIADLRPKSNLLKKLEDFDDGVTCYAIYNPFDSFVVPGTSGLLKKAKINLRVPSLTHMSTFGAKKTLEFIDGIIFGEK